jgi:hypothetical protein
VVQLPIKVIPDVMVNIAGLFGIVLGLRKAFMEQALRFLMETSQPLGYYSVMALLASASRAMLTC